MSTWYGDQFLNLTDKTQPLRFKPTANVIVRAIRTRYIFFGNPSFSDLTVKLYADRAGEVAGLFAPSTTTHQKVDLFSDTHALVETYFEFNYVSMRKNLIFNLITSANGYTYSDGSHISWVKAWPDPVYEDRNPTFEQLGTSSYFLSVIADEL